MLTLIYGISEDLKLAVLKLTRAAIKLQNPENNLHPRLQLLKAEELIQNSTTDTAVMTNSDLIVRRCLRAQIVNSFFELKIIFVSEKGAQTLEITNGRLKDWPEGFMDDDVRESRRMIDTMYNSNRVQDAEGPEGD